MTQTRKQIEDQRRVKLKAATSNVFQALTPRACFKTVAREQTDGDILIKFQGVLFRVKITRSRNQ